MNTLQKNMLRQIKDKMDKIQNSLKEKNKDFNKPIIRSGTNYTKI